jgi:hypothetical protein
MTALDASPVFNCASRQKAGEKSRAGHYIGSRRGLDGSLAKASGPFYFCPDIAGRRPGLQIVLEGFRT